MSLKFDARNPAPLVVTPIGLTLATAALIGRLAQQQKHQEDAPYEDVLLLAPTKNAADELRKLAPTVEVIRRDTLGDTVMRVDSKCFIILAGGSYAWRFRSKYAKAVYAHTRAYNSRLVWCTSGVFDALRIQAYLRFVGQPVPQKEKLIGLSQRYYDSRDWRKAASATLKADPFPTGTAKEMLGDNTQFIRSAEELLGWEDE